jgi:hypothetical protein
VSLQDVLLHFLNFVLPGLFVGALAAGLAKLSWRRQLAAVAWWKLAAWASAACLLVLVAGLLITGRDGEMATYAAMLVACAATLWWGGRTTRAKAKG